MYGNELQQTNFWAKLMTMPSKKWNTYHPENTIKIGEVGFFSMCGLEASGLDDTDANSLKNIMNINIQFAETYTTQKMMWYW